jgi:flagella basal body P-ring formation protein FlgA
MPVAAETATAIANPKAVVALGGPVTVRDRVVELIAKLSGADKNDLRITFADGDEKLLSRPAVGGERFEFEPLSSTGIGRVPVMVRRWRGQKMTTERVTADVSRRYLAVVATGAVSRGEVLTGDDVEIKEVYLDESRGTPMADLSRVVGQECTAQLRAGAVVFASSLKSPVLVKRGDMMTVRCIVGSLVVKTTARAVEDGSMGDAIQVRNERSRGTFYVKVTGSQEGLAVIDAPTAAGKSEGAGK